MHKMHNLDLAALQLYDQVYDYRFYGSPALAASGD